MLEKMSLIAMVSKASAPSGVADIRHVGEELSYPPRTRCVHFCSLFFTDFPLSHYDQEGQDSS
ncbi:hypothetical protein I7I50_09152 [Histoplasma capsulatum G186AR]|uniref:Uncharacterized protein n=1 Tax=Ajellomyces capsulatus TaxID=5037 RepID=A0A8H7YU10_AJECA|nr:hypothetical protein I7I52_06673 [Histoplasma capsulatum]QSS74108.1 hypothetical protein I7I50_09152 [Histoplasma capsulatum G186AR]